MQQSRSYGRALAVSSVEGARVMSKIRAVGAWHTACCYAAVTDMGVVRFAAMAALTAAALACSTEPPVEPQASWTLVAEALDSALISVWGSAEDDVWAVGGDRGSGPLILHWDGEQLVTVDSGAKGDLWWVFGFAGGPVFMGGAGGSILRYQDGAFSATTTPNSNVTVFGLWGSSPEDMWAVGGADGGADGAFAWRLQGDTWLEASGFPAELAADKSLWKVWGSEADNVWLVGSAGVAVHWDGASFQSTSVGGGESLFTVHGVEGRFVAVGGSASGLVFENAGSDWQRADHDPLYALIGVHMVGADQGYAVGRFGAFVEKREGAWREAEGPATIRSLHAIWADPVGGLWTVGGELDVKPVVAGVLAYRGNNPPKGVMK